MLLFHCEKSNSPWKLLQPPIDKTYCCCLVVVFLVFAEPSFKIYMTCVGVAVEWFLAVVVVAGRNDQRWWPSVLGQRLLCGCVSTILSSFWHQSVTITQTNQINLTVKPPMSRKRRVKPYVRLFLAASAERFCVQRMCSCSVRRWHTGVCPLAKDTPQRSFPTVNLQVK